MHAKRKTKSNIVEELNFDKPDFKFEPKGCRYKQLGPYLICQTCEVQHAVYIGTDKIMVGEKKDGTPILKDKS
jgi:hypothetical protein